MATQTETIATTLPLKSSLPSYPHPEWSETFVNYFKDAEEAPPDTSNSTLSEHELRIIRRSDDSPNVARTQVRIRNMRGNEASYSLDKQGFQIAHMDSRMQNWRDEAELKRVFFPEVTELLKRELGAKDVFQYEYHVRSRTLEEALQQDSKGAADINGPVRRVHIDESAKSARREFAYHSSQLPEGNEHLQGRQYGIYNVWKPIKTVYKDPLCLCDTRTLKDADLQGGEITVPGVGEIENYAIRAPGAEEEGRHEYAYLRAQEPNEAYLFRIYDSRMDGGIQGESEVDKRSHGAAHTSFIDPGTENAPARESVEVRSFCVF